MKRFALVLLIAAFLLSLVMVYGKVLRSRAQSRQREAVALEAYKNDLPVGTSRARVEEYFESRSIGYQLLTATSRLRPSGAFAVPLGPASVDSFCDWSAYLIFEFRPKDASVGESDLLVNIRAVDLPQNCL